MQVFPHTTRAKTTQFRSQRGPTTFLAFAKQLAKEDHLLHDQH